MPRILNLMLLLLLKQLVSSAQITLQLQDLPSQGDTLRYSIAGVPAFVQPGASGEDKTWNFTQLSTNTQYIDRFSSVSGTNFVFLLSFGLPGNNFCNLAKTENNGPELPAQSGIQFSDVFNFYRTADTAMVQKGFGASLNGIPIPVPYSAPETVYAFPLSYDHRDTSEYDYEVSLPGIGYYGRKALRTNHVDGWGTLNTDFGSFEALRIRSVLQAVDTVALDTLGQGIRIPLPDEIKYKWVAKEHGWPLLEITATDLFGLEIANRVVYRDFKMIDTGIEESESLSLSASIYPNPASAYLMAECETRHPADLTYQIFGSDGRLLYEVSRKNVAPGKVLEAIPLSTMQLSQGLYFIRIGTASGTASMKPFLVDNH